MEKVMMWGKDARRIIISNTYLMSRKYLNGIRKSQSIPECFKVGATTYWFGGIEERTWLTWLNHSSSNTSVSAIYH